jgi:hypothetical protein
LQQHDLVLYAWRLTAVNIRRLARRSHDARRHASPGAWPCQASRNPAHPPSQYDGIRPPAWTGNFQVAGVQGRFRARRCDWTCKGISGNDPKSIRGKQEKMTELGARNLILHIGDPKTGTSSIQRALQLGLVESPAGKISSFTAENDSVNAVTLARSFRKEGEKPEPPMRAVKSWLGKNNANIQVISSEFFSSANPAYLHHVFTQHHPELMKNARVIAYVRPHVGRALAAYTERTKCGYTLSNFDEWLPAFIKSNKIKYFPRFQKWRNVFGDQFTLRPFLRSELRKGDAVEDFFTEVFGPENFSVKNAVNENQSITLKALAGLRSFNRAMVDSGIPAKQRIPLARGIYKDLPAETAAAKPKMDRDSILLIAHAYRKDAKRLDTEFFNKSLFLNELNEAARNAPEEPIDLTLGKYFDASEQAALSEHTRAIGKLMETNHARWERYYQENRRLYNIGRPLITNGGGEIQRHLEDLTALLS